MPFICIGPVCIPWTAFVPLVVWLARPVWVRLPPHVQKAIQDKYGGATKWMQRVVWDRLGWKEKAPAKGEAALASGECTSEQLRASMGKVAGLHSNADWEAALQLTRESDVALVVDFTAVWCGPCQRIAPFFAELAAKHAARGLFVKVDVDELEDVAAGAEVMAMPTFHVYKKGEKVGSMTGANEQKLAKLAQEFAS